MLALPSQIRLRALRTPGRTCALGVVGALFYSPTPRPQKLEVQVRATGPALVVYEGSAGGKRATRRVSATGPATGLFIIFRAPTQAHTAASYSLLRITSALK